MSAGLYDRITPDEPLVEISIARALIEFADDLRRASSDVETWVKADRGRQVDQ